MKYKVKILKYKKELMIEIFEDDFHEFPIIYSPISIVNKNYQFNIFSKQGEIKNVVNNLIKDDYISLLKVTNDYSSYFRNGDEFIYDKQYTFSLTSKALLELL